jgi:hypothetical protein
MSRDSSRYLIALGLLVAALIAAGLFAWLPALRRPVGGESGYIFAGDIDNWRETDLRRMLRTPYNLALGPDLKKLPLRLGRWQGEDIPQTNLEVYILLEPEEYVYRRYTDDAGEVVWLSIIGSHKSKSFHPPQICYSADGWTTQVSTAPFALAQGGELYALYVDAAKEEQRHAIFYFYLWPKITRDPADGTVLFKVTVPLAGAGASADAARALAQDFLQQVFTQATQP